MSALGRGAVGRANAGWAVPPVAQRLDQGPEGKAAGDGQLSLSGSCHARDRPEQGWNYFFLM